MTADALEIAKEHLSAAADTVRELAPGGIDDAKARAAELARIALEHGHDAVASSGQAAHDGAEALGSNRGRVFAATAMLVLAIAAVVAGTRARRA